MITRNGKDRIMTETEVKNLLTCPGCTSNWFSQVQLGTFQSGQLDFVTTVQPVERKVTYICAECGHPVESLEEPNKMLMIITGNSEGDKRLAMHDAGFEIESWGDLLLEDNILFVTKLAEEEKSEEIEDLLAGSLVHYIDLSEGEYEPEALAQAVSEVLRKKDATENDKSTETAE